MRELIASWFGQAGLDLHPFLTNSYSKALKNLAATNLSAAFLPTDKIEDQTRMLRLQAQHLYPPTCRRIQVDELPASGWIATSTKVDRCKTSWRVSSLPLVSALPISGKLIIGSIAIPVISDT